jgi:regulatory factor X, other
MMLNSTLPGVVLPLSRPASSPSSSSASTTSSTAYSRPQAEGAGYLANLSMSEAHLSDNLYQSAHFSHSPPSLLALPHSRHSSNASATSYSLASTGIPSPADSPPSATSTTSSTIKHSNNLGPIPRTTIRRARTGTSPYPREPHIHSSSDVYSSASETEDLHMYLPTHHHHQPHHQHHPQQQLQPQQLQPHGHPMQDPYGSMYMHPSVAHIDPMQSIQQRPPLHHSTPVGVAPPSSYGGRVASSDHNLEQLANNVRSATTTSASDRAKQIFVHAWYVFSPSFFLACPPSRPRPSHELLTLKSIGRAHNKTHYLGLVLRRPFPSSLRSFAQDATPFPRLTPNCVLTSFVPVWVQKTCPAYNKFTFR